MSSELASVLVALITLAGVGVAGWVQIKLKRIETRAAAAEARARRNECRVDQLAADVSNVCRERGRDRKHHCD